MAAETAIQTQGEIIPNHTHTALGPKLAFVTWERCFGIVTASFLRTPPPCSEAIFKKVNLEYYSELLRKELGTRE